MNIILSHLPISTLITVRCYHNAAIPPSLSLYIEILRLLPWFSPWVVITRQMTWKSNKRFLPGGCSFWLGEAVMRYTICLCVCGGWSNLQYSLSHSLNQTNGSIWSMRMRQFREIGRDSIVFRAKGRGWGRLGGSCLSSALQSFIMLSHSLHASTNTLINLHDFNCACMSAGLFSYLFCIIVFMWDAPSPTHSVCNVIRIHLLVQKQQIKSEDV